MRKGFASAIHIFCIYVGLINDWVHRPSNRRAANVVAAHIYLYYDSKRAIFEIEQFCLRCTEKAPLKKIGLAPKSDWIVQQTEMECSRELLNKNEVQSIAKSFLEELILKKRQRRESVQHHYNKMSAQLKRFTEKAPLKKIGLARWSNIVQKAPLKKIGLARWSNI